MEKRNGDPPFVRGYRSTAWAAGFRHLRWSLAVVLTVQVPMVPLAYSGRRQGMDLVGKRIGQGSARGALTGTIELFQEFLCAALLQKHPLPCPPLEIRDSA